MLKHDPGKDTATVTLAWLPKFHQRQQTSEATDAPDLDLAESSFRGKQTQSILMQRGNSNSTWNTSNCKDVTDETSTTSKSQHQRPVVGVEVMSLGEVGKHANLGRAGIVRRPLLLDQAGELQIKLERKKSKSS